MVNGKKMYLKTKICQATHLNKDDKRKYYTELGKYDTSTLRKILILI